MIVSWKQEDIFIGFIFLGLICHGMYFAREWVVLGAGLLINLFILWRTRSQNIIYDFLHIRDKHLKGSIITFSMLIFFSLAGVLHPVRKVEGWLEAFRWLIFLGAYLWGRQIGHTEELQNRILNKITITALISILLVWLPGSEMIWAPPGAPENARFAATFGYPNAAASFIGCQLLFLQKDRKLKMPYFLIFLISMLSTGSRAAAILLIFVSVLLFLKRVHLRGKKDFQSKEKNIRWMSKSLTWGIILTSLLLSAIHFQGSVQHLLDWNYATLSERITYYLDCLKLAKNAHFLPQAGGWFAFPLIQTVPYFTLYPHSSICQVMLNQGIAGVLLLLLWAVKGMISYCRELWKGRDLIAVSSKSAIVFLGLHSLVDVDMSFGVLGIIFWFLAGMNSRRTLLPPPAYDVKKGR
ncbi:MAG: hypothetical protein AWM53_01053 [Candidatus Dichloromethanomonas elyunquensis]|nr:MAG: hypothetical protein AWM53_01053 [Candidatus Dichloromethanomonas elyunquensis]